jgi:cell division protein ZapA (FtsZ GTPase activity inhibitor)
MSIEKLQISVFLAERKYTLSVLPEEEAGARTAVEYINKQIHDMSSKYALKDRQDVLALIALMNTTKMIDLENKSDYIDNSLGQTLQGINALLDNSLA